jgi:hypothetical protein
MVISEVWAVGLIADDASTPAKFNAYKLKVLETPKCDSAYR